MNNLYFFDLYITKTHIFEARENDTKIYSTMYKGGKIIKFLKTNNTYNIWIDNYSNQIPILKVDIFDSEVHIYYTRNFSRILTKSQMNGFLKSMDNAYTIFHSQVIHGRLNVQQNVENI